MKSTWRKHITWCLIGICGWPLLADSQEKGDNSKSQKILMFETSSTGAKDLKNDRIGFKSIYLGDEISTNDSRIANLKCQSYLDVWSKLPGNEELLSILRTARNNSPADYVRFAPEINFNLYDCTGTVSLFERTVPILVTTVNNVIVSINTQLENSDVPLMIEGLSKSLGTVTKQDFKRSAAQVREEAQITYMKKCDDIALMFKDNPALAQSEISRCKREIPARMAMLTVPSGGIMTLKGRWEFPKISATYETISSGKTQFTLAYEPYLTVLAEFSDHFSSTSVEFIKKANAAKTRNRSNDF